MRQQLLERQQKELKKRVDDLKKQQETEEARACLELNKLMRDVWTATNPVLKQLVWKTKSHKIEIRLPTGYPTPGGGQ